MTIDSEDREPGWVKRRRVQRSGGGKPSASRTQAAHRTALLTPRHPKIAAWRTALEHGVSLQDADQLIARLGVAEADRVIRAHGENALVAGDALASWRARGVEPLGAGVVRVSRWG